MAGLRLGLGRRVQGEEAAPPSGYSDSSDPPAAGAEAWDASCSAAGFAPRIVQEAVQVQTLLSLVESGLGVALVPSASQAQASMGLAFKAFTGANERLDVAIAVATHAQTESPVAKRFRELLIEVSEGTTLPGHPAITPP